MAWIVLIISGALETVWAVALAQSDGLRKIRATIVFLVSMIVSMAGLGYAMTQISTGTAYAVWVGIGATGTVLWSAATELNGSPRHAPDSYCYSLCRSLD